MCIGVPHNVMSWTSVMLREILAEGEPPTRIALPEGSPRTGFLPRHLPGEGGGRGAGILGRERSLWIVSNKNYCPPPLPGHTLILYG